MSSIEVPTEQAIKPDLSLNTSSSGPGSPANAPPNGHLLQAEASSKMQIFGASYLANILR